MKQIIMISMVIGSAVGSYLPSLWGEGWLSLSSVLFSALGGLLGIWIGYKISKQM